MQTLKIQVLLRYNAFYGGDILHFLAGTNTNTKIAAT